MGRKKYLIDTNIAIEYISELLPEKALTVLDGIIDGQFYISVINRIELLGFAGITENEEHKFQELINAANVIGLDEDVITTTIRIRKQYRIKLPDAIIAATALANNLTLISRNSKDFRGIENLKVVNPYDMG